MPTYTKYPNAIDGSNELPVTVDLRTAVEAEVPNRLRSATLAIENELGVNPSGTYGTVRARLDALEIDFTNFSDTFIHRDGSLAFTGNQSLGGYKLTNLGAATNNKDALSYGQAGANLADLTVDVGGITTTTLTSSAGITTTTLTSSAGITTTTLTSSAGITTTTLNATGIISTSGGVTVTGGAIDLDPTSSVTLDMDAGQTATITISDNIANAFLIQEGTNHYININTNNTTESLNFGNITTNPDYNFLGSGTTTFNGPISILSSLTITLPDNTNNALLIQEGTNAYIEIDTINNQEVIKFGNITTDPIYQFLGDGYIDFPGETTHATAGTARYIDGSSAQARNTLDSANKTIWLASGNDLYYGDDTNTTTLYTRANTSIINRVFSNQVLGIFNGYIEVGTTPNKAKSGEIRFGNTDACFARDSLNLNDVRIWQLTAGDNLYIGNIKAGITSLFALDQAGLNVNNTYQLSTYNGYVEMGSAANKATTGQLRLPNAFECDVRNSLNNANIRLWEVDSNNHAYFADSNTINTYIASKNTTIFKVNSNNQCKIYDGYFEMGTSTPFATSGDFRYGDSISATARTAADSGNKTIWLTDGYDLYYGDDSNTEDIYLRASTSIINRVNSTQQLGMFNNYIEMGSAANKATAGETRTGNNFFCYGRDALNTQNILLWGLDTDGYAWYGGLNVSTDCDTANIVAASEINLVVNGSEMFSTNTTRISAENNQIQNLADGTAAKHAINLSQLQSERTPHYEEITTENITGTDTALADTLNNTPKDVTAVVLFLNGIAQDYGAGRDYTISGTTITWLANTGTAVDMTVSDVLFAYYVE